MARPTINELEEFFSGLEVPYDVVLPSGEVILDIKKFASSHIGYCKGQKGNKGYLPYYERLEQAMLICK